jgi:photosystem II stability/assembly factor-like uncharacterized protein
MKQTALFCLTLLLCSCTNDQPALVADPPTTILLPASSDPSFVSFGLTGHSAIQSILSTDDRILFAGTRSHGILRSDDSGKTWARLDSTDWIGFSDVLCIARGEGKALLAGGEFGLFRTTNYGRSWMHHQAEHDLIWSVGIDGPNYFAGATFGGFYFSSDYGTTWSFSNSGLDVYSMLGVARVPNGTLYAATPTGLYRSTDTNRTWTKSNALPQQPVLSLISNGDNTLFAGTQNGIYRSIDGGTSFEKVLNLYCNYLDMNAAGMIVAASEGEIWLSTNNGISWKQIFVWQDDNDVIRSLAVSPNGMVYCGTLHSGLFKSTAPFTR